MSLMSHIEPKNCSHDELEAVLKEIDCPEILSIACSPKKKWFGLVQNPECYISIWLHDLLTDDADWSAETWDMDKSGLAVFADFLEIFARKFGKDFSFSAIWAGDEVEMEKHVTVTELVQIVKSGKIGTKTKYIVKVPI